MATNAIISAASLDINKVSFGDIRTNAKGGKTVPVKYNGQSLQIRFPRMNYPMGILIKETDNGMSYTLSATMKGCDPFAKDAAVIPNITANSTQQEIDTAAVGNLYNFLLGLQEKLVKTATDNSAKWFGKSRKEDVIRDTMKAILSPSVEKVDGVWTPSGKYPPSLRMKVPVYDGKVSMDVTDSEGNPVPLDPETLASVFPKRVDASIVVSPSVYVTGQGFGVTWRIGYARVSQPQRMTARDVFADEIRQEVNSKPAPRQAVVTDEDEGEDATQEEDSVQLPTQPAEEESPAPVPAPAPAAASKNRRRVVAAA